MSFFSSGTGAHDVAPKTAAARLGQPGHLLLDVREPAEVAEQGVPGALAIPLGDLPRELARLDPNATIDVICKSGGRSARAAALLREHGFAGAQSIAGGILAWAAAGLPTTRGA